MDCEREEGKEAGGGGRRRQEKKEMIFTKRYVWEIIPPIWRARTRPLPSGARLTSHFRHRMVHSCNFSIPSPGMIWPSTALIEHLSCRRSFCQTSIQRREGGREGTTIPISPLFTNKQAGKSDSHSAPRMLQAVTHTARAHCASASASVRTSKCLSCCLLPFFPSKVVRSPRERKKV